MNAKFAGNISQVSCDTQPLLNPFVHRLELNTTYEKIKVSKILPKLLFQKFVFGPRRLVRCYKAKQYCLLSELQCNLNKLVLYLRLNRMDYNVFVHVPCYFRANV